MALKPQHPALYQRCLAAYRAGHVLAVATLAALFQVTSFQVQGAAINQPWTYITLFTTLILFAHYHACLIQLGQDLAKDRERLLAYPESIYPSLFCTAVLRMPAPPLQWVHLLGWLITHWLAPLGVFYYGCFWVHRTGDLVLGYVLIGATSLMTGILILAWWHNPLTAPRRWLGLAVAMGVFAFVMALWWIQQQKVEPVVWVVPGTMSNLEQGLTGPGQPTGMIFLEGHILLVDEHLVLRGLTCREKADDGAFTEPLPCSARTGKPGERKFPFEQGFAYPD